MEACSNQKVYIDLICFPLNVLGPNKRVGVWFQGCDIGCSDCMSPHTWEQTSDKIMSLDSLIIKLKSFGSIRLTISGGEPFNQSDELLFLLENVRESFVDILLYSGYEFEYLRDNFPEILRYIDVLIDGPFMKNLETNKAYKGSLNQKMYILNNDLLPVYQNYILELKKNLQVHNSKNNVYILGIPRLNDYQQIESNLRSIRK